jgi:nucleoid DNA-binding protein
MTKPELITAIAKHVGITKRDAEEVLNVTIWEITNAIAGTGRFAYPEFGVFKKYQSAACSRPNPQDRTTIIHTPARNTVKFKPSRALKAAVQ